MLSVTALITNVTVKVSDDGSGSQNVFYMLSGSDTGDGTRSPILDVYFGMKIRFDTSDSSLSGHNFKFSTTADGTNGEETLQQMLQLRYSETFRIIYRIRNNS